MEIWPSTVESMVNLSDSFWKDKKVLVTGHTGFKGSWLVIWLRMLGAEVTGYALEPITSKDNFVVVGLDKVVNHMSGIYVILISLLKFSMKLIQR